MALLTRELEKLIESYRDHRQGYDEILTDIERIEAKFDALVKEYGLVGPQKNKAESDKRAELKVLNEELRALRKSFEAERDDILAGIESKFGRNYQINPEMLDGNVIKLLEKGAYKERELIDLFNSYSQNGNLAMMRYVSKVGEEILESGKAQDASSLRVMSHRANNITPIYADIAMGLAETCNRSLGIRGNAGGLSGIDEFSKQAHELAKGWATKKFDEFAQDYMTRAEGITDKMPLQTDMI